MKKQPETDRYSDKDQDGIPDFIDSGFDPELYEYVDIIIGGAGRGLEFHGNLPGNNTYTKVFE